MEEYLHSENLIAPKANNGEKKEKTEEAAERSYKMYEEMLSSLPTEKGWLSDQLRQFQGFWFQPMHAVGAMMAQQEFKDQNVDVLLVTSPKSGTTWLKAIIFAIMNRTKYDFSTHPLLSISPHDCVPFLENFYKFTTPVSDQKLEPSPYLLATHIPYTLLPESIINSECRLVYICRNPKDVFVSLYHFMTKVRSKELTPITLEEALDLFCKEVSPYGPYWDHVLGFWKASLELPNKVLYIKYEEMKREPLVYTKKLAEFVGQPFSLEEEEKGVVQEILKLCSFESLSNLEINKTGVYRVGMTNNVFFRQGKVGDWENHLTTDMIKRIDQITEQKLSGSGLTL